MYKYLYPSLATLLLCACGGGVQLDRSSTAVRVASALPPPDSRTIPIEVAPYRIAPGDELTVSIFGAPELDRTSQVDSAGNFTLPLAGTINAAGKTPQEFSSLVEAKLRGPYLKNPRVSVAVKQGIQQLVTIDGEVGAPGVYPVLGQMTLQQAIATAKGTSDEASLDNVIVFRTVGGQKMAAMFNLKDIRSGRYPDPQIYGNDIVVVGESAFARFIKNSSRLPLLGRFMPFIF